MKPWLCVLVPTLDGAEFVAAALASVERENDSGIHCIVVDGGSKDATHSILQWFEARIPDRKSTRLNSSHIQKSRMPSSA